MEERNKKIVAFADKWIAKFSDKHVTCYELTDIEFGNDCFALDFVMDCGDGFCEKYHIETIENGINILDKINDLDCLASGIFSKWRYYNHWAYSSSEIDEHRDWFIVMLNRLKELANKE